MGAKCQLPYSSTAISKAAYVIESYSSLASSNLISIPYLSSLRTLYDRDAASASSVGRTSRGPCTPTTISARSWDRDVLKSSLVYSYGNILTRRTVLTRVACVIVGIFPSPIFLNHHC